MDAAARNADPHAESTESVDVQQQAAVAAARVPDEFLKEILNVIAESDPKQTPEEIAASVSGGENAGDCGSPNFRRNV